MSDCAMVLTFFGSSARNSGLKPPISASRSSAGCVREIGISPPAGSRSIALSALELQVAVADQVLVADRGGGRLVQRQRAIDGEVDHRLPAAVDQARR